MDGWEDRWQLRAKENRKNEFGTKGAMGRDGTENRKGNVITGEEL